MKGGPTYRVASRRRNEMTSRDGQLKGLLIFKTHPSSIQVGLSILLTMTHLKGDTQTEALLQPVPRRTEEARLSSHQQTLKLLHRIGACQISVFDFQPGGRGFYFRSSRHVGTLGKFFTYSCLWASA